MQDHIENLVKGIFEYENAKLSLSEKKLELSVESGRPAAGSFRITSSKERKVKGRIFTSTPRMKCKITEFDDFCIDVPYSFDDTGMEEGDVLKGEISILSEAGEYTLPFVVSIVHSVIKSSVGNIKNLFHFTNLAQSDFNEAVKVFYSEEFKKVFVNSDRVFFNTYRGLSTIKGLPENVEEFLISIHKKSPVRYYTEEAVVIENAEEEDAREITVTKSGWGYVSVQVEAEGDFLKPEKERLTDDDFLGNKCTFSCVIDRNKLHGGNNYGSLLLRTSHSDIRIAFTVKCAKKHRAVHDRHMDMRKWNLELTSVYLDFRLKQMNTPMWIERSMRLVERMLSADEKNVPARLFQAQLLLSKKRPNEAKWILDHVEGELEIAEQGAELYGYYLYLRALEAEDGIFVEEMTKMVRELYSDHRNSGRLLWILLYLDERLASSPEKKLSELEHLYKTGNTSPVLYLEGYRIFAENPLLLGKLEAYEQQVLFWAVKQGLYRKELADQVSYLSGKQKRFEALLHKILTAYYEVFQTDELLSAICIHLMRANRVGEEDFPWYEKAVERELRITRLYEYYLYAVPFQEKRELPRMIQMYFAYDCNLNYRKTAWLYENLIRYGDKNPDILRSYEVQMEQFAVKQIEAHHLDVNLAAVYEFMMTKEEVRRTFHEHFAEFVFLHRIALKGQQSVYKYAVVVREQFKEETRVPFSEGEVFVELYGNSYEIFLEDAKGRRYHEELPITITPFFRPAEYMGMMEQIKEPSIGISVYMSEGNRHYISIDERNDRFVRAVVESEKIREDYKREIRQNLLQYYYDHDRILELDDFLKEISLEELYARERAEITELMVRLGRYKEAYAIVRKYGTENIHSKVLVKLASRMIQEQEGEKESYLVGMAHTAFRAGKYDIAVLTYLTEFYEGTTKERRNIWKAAVNFDVDTHGLEENLLIQMLYTHSFVGEKQDIFDSYVKKGACTSVVLAYLSYNAYEYFIKDSLMEEGFFEMLLREHERGEELNDMCRLSLIKYFSEGKRQGTPSPLYTKEAEEITIGFLRSFLERGVVFQFFMAFEKEVDALSAYADRTFIEYKAMPGSRVVLHYVLEGENGENTNYQKEEMHNLFGGIFSKQFILFFGDTLQYYITEEIKGKEHLTQSRVISRNDINMGGRETRYDVLNDMLIGRTLQDDASLLDLMEVYRKKERAVSALFRLE